MSILITGIAGTLGRSFTKLLLSENKFFYGYDTNEWAVAEFKEDFPGVAVYLRDFGEWTYNKRPCELIIHAAAFKHLSLGEQNVGPFIDNNIVKTKKLFEEAEGHGVEIIFISSDKAVEPINLYGMTKAVGEYLAREHGGYIARCGNFLGSSGSVIPAWEKALREHKPIKVTNRKMKRYVIDPDNAAKQIWDGYNAGKRLIIPKCKEVSVGTLLKMMLYKRGRGTHSPLRIYGVKTIGIRPGEKLREKLKWDWE